jgi:uncharacterized protein (DUF1330 family)
VPAYITVQIDIFDPVQFREYGKAWDFRSFTADYGGEIIFISDDAPDPIEGEWSGRLVVMKFPDVAQARGWYDSPQYREVRKIRKIRWASSAGTLAIHQGRNVPGNAGDVGDDET